jgi:beta-phosphoglucomutase-like phosphatase (HAD superfamily)
VPAKKPAPDIYHYALEKMGLNPADCLAFEDSENGLRASLGAGLKTLVTVNDYTLDHDFTGAMVVLSDLGEPGTPNQRLAGADLNQPFVDVAYLRTLHQG